MGRGSRPLVSTPSEPVVCATPGKSALSPGGMRVARDARRRVPPPRKSAEVRKRNARHDATESPETQKLRTPLGSSARTKRPSSFSFSGVSLFLCLFLRGRMSCSSSRHRGFSLSLNVFPRDVWDKWDGFRDEIHVSCHALVYRKIRESQSICFFVSKSARVK